MRPLTLFPDFRFVVLFHVTKPIPSFVQIESRLPTEPPWVEVRKIFSAIEVDRQETSLNQREILKKVGVSETSAAKVKRKLDTMENYEKEEESIEESLSPLLGRNIRKYG